MNCLKMSRKNKLIGLYSITGVLFGLWVLNLLNPVFWVIMLTVSVIVDEFKI